jgi:cyclic-di-AMP phosphodiesterase
MEKDFTVLERVRHVAKEFASELSASIGIAVSSNRSDELAETAAEALDIANKRGGDQAVVMIEGEPIRYVGGTTASVAKRSRVKSRMIANRVRQEMNQASKVLLLTHKTPDHDALGAVVGMTNLAFTLKDEVYWYVDPPASDDVKEFYDKILAMNKTVHGRNVKINVLTDVTDLNGFDPLTIIVDVNNKDITYGEVAKVTGKKIVIDHHRQGGKEIDAEVSFVEPYASSTCEIVTEVLQYFEDEIELSETEATLMLAGIVIDTNRFSVATGSRTFDAASYLKNNGANLQDLQKNLREDYETLIQRSRLLSQTKRMNKGFGVVFTEEYLSNKDRAKLAETVLSINDFDASLVVSKEDEGLYGMSIRSLGDVNVQLIAEALGGGGHLTSAGGVFKETTLKKIEQQITNLLG